MAIILPGGFNITNSDPVDSRFSLADQSARYALSSANIYEGLLVYQRDTNTLWVLTNTAQVSNENGWEQIVQANTGTFQVYATYSDLTAVSAHNFTNGQIVYVVDTDTLYQADLTYANLTTEFQDFVTWNIYTFTNSVSYEVANGLTSSVSGSTTVFSLDTDSLYFQRGVENTISSGSFTIDCGKI